MNIVQQALENKQEPRENMTSQRNPRQRHISPLPGRSRISQRCRSSASLTARISARAWLILLTAEPKTMRPKMLAKVSIESSSRLSGATSGGLGALITSQRGFSERGGGERSTRRSRCVAEGMHVLREIGLVHGHGDVDPTDLASKTKALGALQTRLLLGMSGRCRTKCLKDMVG